MEKEKLKCSITESPSITTGKRIDLELTAPQARNFLWYASMANVDDSTGPKEYPLSKKKQEARIRRCSTIEEQADNFKTHLQMIAKLDVRQLGRLIGLLDLMEYGDSWMLEIIEGLLDESYVLARQRR